ncbi:MULTISPECIES: bifunctional hydroxymethylpyrimidine kinase/phosphomethylpyrimidine kinase [Rhizobium]|uniref:Bifunctional hydroxymethylpyrimidine kinase/phosphomethylpyrimidine kinase n=1 Tax=Rhizobium aouanii TaxID=3118145 RepID=A0ABU8CYN6_9HYPH|nr:bifunctional hydroxymethylpyrimidine kinase/phosphomethylpyrimidine kinase [Rhizobium acaciae]MCW1414122.1 bifunctional hydroxymethylpyrimidine kinase/phosphomethylpyrimidine kinase [Rhizobium acaciae]MCW1746287.1 bifunctional hydroxymethylpyrimidine kinase/phosphomethylpyrimidine kinase [Rhizobium acaciae]MCW1754117.1 bifunctional hydroxymethylpyrimidine kinase/phosphomethylpyrimidine kinase [Rhizobium acaciae]
MPTDCGTACCDVEIGRQALQLLDMGCPAVLVKGGHRNGALAIDTLYATGIPPRHFALPRRQATLRGTGCMLPSAIAAHLALGHDMQAAVSLAKTFMDENFDAEGGQSSRFGPESAQRYPP